MGPPDYRNTAHRLFSFVAFVCFCSNSWVRSRPAGAALNQNNLLPGLAKRHNPTVQQTCPEFPDATIVSPSGRTFHVSWNGRTEDHAWDDFLLTLPDGHHEQTSLWGSVRASIGWTVARVVMREDGEVVAGAQVQLQAIQRLGRWAYITFGPCSAGNDSEAGKILMAEIKRFLLRERAADAPNCGPTRCCGGQ